MAENTKLCYVCDKSNVKKPATVWCSECDQTFCTECNVYHSRIPSSSTHATIPLAHYLALDPSIIATGSYCTIHDEKYQMYCQTDDNPLCLSCIEDHSECKITSFRNVMANVKTSGQITEVEKNLEDIERNASKLQGYGEENLRAVNNETKAILVKIQQTRQEINNHLDELESRFKTEVGEISTKVQEQCRSTINTVCTEKEKAQNTKSQIDLIKQYATDLQTYFALRKMSADVSSSEQILQKMKENSRIDKVTIECDIDDGLAQITWGIQSFGQIRVHNTSRHITLESHKDKQAQVKKETSQSVEKIEFKLVKTFNIESEGIYGCSFLRDGIMIFTDNDKTRLICVDADGKQLFTVSTGLYRPVHVCCIDDTTVAVTSRNNLISIVNVSSRTVKKHINVGYSCYGVTHRSGTLLVCASYHGILSINVTNEQITTLVQCDDLSCFSYITTYKDKLYYANSNTKSVTCCDMDGKTLWIFGNETSLHDPCGIATDNGGRVYVADRSKSAVVVLSADGRQSKIILSERNGLEHAHALSIDKSSNKLLVSNYLHKTFLFDLLS